MTRYNVLFILVVWTVSFTTDGLGQGQKIKSSYYENISPKQPGKGSLGTFGNTKINYYTGMPEITLDLFTLQGRELSLPISLSYDATGVRTDDLSGPVGMKWNLNAGGSITRDLNGLADEHPNNGYWKFSKQTNYYTNLNPTDWTTKCENAEWDGEPDSYTININGRTIRFVFDQNKVAYTIPRQNVRINYTLTSSSDPNQVRINKFDVTMEDGTRYTFGGNPESVEERKIEKFVVKTAFNYITMDQCPEYESVFLQDSADFVFYCEKGFEEKFSTDVSTSTKTINFYNSRWHLTSITVPGGESINFTYQKLANVVYSLKPSSIWIAPVGGKSRHYREIRDIKQ